jgi:single-stranded-DNA-specific exonuclease
MLVKKRSTSSQDIFADILAARNIKDPSQLHKDLNLLLSFRELTDIDKASSRLMQAIMSQENIMIIGDFDADGATSTALAVKALRAFGAEHVEFLVPNRFEFGYGLSKEIVTIAAKKNPKVLITVDNGISSFEGVDAANSFGIDVIITDHHLASHTLPNALAIVNPNRKDDAFASKSIAGVGVIFYVMSALRRKLADNGYFANKQIPNMVQFLDLVALGTVADVVALDHNNRILVHNGIKLINENKACFGIKALCEIANRDCKRLRAQDLGFALGPRLNAAGRLDDMSVGISCLLAESMKEALDLAHTLEKLNSERKDIQTSMVDEALKILDALSYKVENLQNIPSALCLLNDAWHQGVIGILASRIKDLYKKPVIIFAKVSDNEIKGSARSISILNIRDVLANIDSKYPGLITKFGGHAMAAGLSLNYENFTKFQQAFVQEVEILIQGIDVDNALLSDGSLQYKHLSLDFTKQLAEYGPWGQGFPEPCFDNIFEILDQRIVGSNHLKLTLKLHKDPEDKSLDAIAFNVDLNNWPNHRASYIHALYRLDINSYKDIEKTQLMISALEVISTTT